jgi:hypothetical protein
MAARLSAVAVQGVLPPPQSEGSSDWQDKVFVRAVLCCAELGPAVLRCTVACCGGVLLWCTVGCAVHVMWCDWVRCSVLCSVCAGVCCAVLLSIMLRLIMLFCAVECTVLRCDALCCDGAGKPPVMLWCGVPTHPLLRIVVLSNRKQCSEPLQNETSGRA